MPNLLLYTVYSLNVLNFVLILKNHSLDADLVIIIMHTSVYACAELVECGARAAQLANQPHPCFSNKGVAPSGYAIARNTPSIDIARVAPLQTKESWLMEETRPSPLSLARRGRRWNSL